MLNTPDYEYMVWEEWKDGHSKIYARGFDIDGNETARRTINIDIATSMTGASNSIEAQIAAVVDDNSDSNATNDIDDYTDHRVFINIGFSIHNSM